MHVLYQLIDAIRSQNPDSAYRLAERLEGLARESAYPAGPGLGYLGWAMAYFSKGEADSVIHGARQALSVLEEERYGKRRAHAFHLLGVGYYRRGDYDSALTWYERAVRLRRALGDNKGLVASYNNIGLIYSDQGQYAEALEYHQKALAIREAIGDKARLASSYNNIGLIYSAQGRYAEALEYYQKSLRISEAIGDKYGLTFSSAGVGYLYFLQGQPHRGRPYLLRALARELNAYDRLQEIYLYLSRTDSALAASGQPAYWKTAYEYARLHHAYSDSVSNKETIRKQAQLESQYEYDKKTALLKAQREKERALAAAELQRRETQRNLSLLAFGITLAGMIVFALLYRTIRRQKKLLQVQAEEIREKNIALEQYNAELQKTNQELETSYQIIRQQANAFQEKNEEILDSIRYAERIQAGDFAVGGEVVTAFAE